MLVDGGLRHDPGDRGSAGASVRGAAEVGFDRLFVAETAHDPFLPIALGADAAVAAGTTLGTGIAVALARNPMTVAVTARDLQELTEGRFVLGLGTQVKAHVTRRFSMPWTHPAARMREFVQALRAIWTSWQDGSRLSFEGEFYRHTLSAPLFDPGPSAYAPPAVHLAAVGPRMTEVAGEVADGLLCHTFSTPSYVEQVTLPALRRGQERAGRGGPIDVSLPVMLATGPPGADLTGAVADVRRTIAFYGSTPAYRGVLDHHGWGDLHEELHRLSAAQRWDEMPGLVDDTVVSTMALVCDADGLADAVRARWGGLLTAVRLNVPYLDDPATWTPVVQRLKEDAWTT